MVLSIYSPYVFFNMCLPLVGGIVTIAIVANSQLKRSLRYIFLIFCTFQFILLPLLGLVVMLFNFGRSGFNSWWNFAFRVAFPLLSSLSAAMLVVVATQLARLGQKNDSAPIGRMATPAAGPVWNTEEIAPLKKNQTLRRREWAYLIDILPLLIGTIVYSNIAARLAAQNPFRRFDLTGFLFAIFCLCMAAYILCKDSIRGISVGKHVSKCRVVDFDTGAPIGISQSLLRNLSLALLPIALIEFVVAIIRPDHRRLGDLMANTVVVHGPPDEIDGIAVAAEAIVIEKAEKHPLDD